MTEDVVRAFKILRAEEWAALERDGSFAGSPADLADGFIHMSTASQLRGTADKHFAGEDGLTLAEVAVDALGDDLSWEPSRGGDLFPHLYNRLAVDAATDVFPLPWRDGVHEFPDL